MASSPECPTLACLDPNPSASMDASVRGLVTPLSKQQRQRHRHRYKASSPTPRDPPPHPALFFSPSHPVSPWFRKTAPSCPSDPSRPCRSAPLPSSSYRVPACPRQFDRTSPEPAAAPQGPRRCREWDVRAGSRPFPSPPCRPLPKLASFSRLQAASLPQARSMAFGKCHGSRPLQVATFSSLTPHASACAGSTGSRRPRLMESSPSLLCFLSCRGRPPEPAASLVAAVRAEEDDASTSTARIALDHLAGPARVLKPIRSVRIRSTTLIRLLHRFVLLPSGMSGKMIISLDSTTIIAMLIVSFLLLWLCTYHLFVKLPKMAS